MDSEDRAFATIFCTCVIASMFVGIIFGTLKHIEVCHAIDKGYIQNAQGYWTKEH